MDGKVQRTRQGVEGLLKMRLPAARAGNASRHGVMPSSSTSNTNVAFGPMSGGPLSP